MELPVIGQVEKPEELDLEPIVVPLAGYKVVKGKVVEEIERFPFKPMMPSGARALMDRSLGAGGEIGYSVVVILLDRCLIEDAKERWAAFLDREDLNVEQGALGQVMTALYEVYSGRPTRRRSASDGTGPRRARTSKGAQPSTA